ncbi:hypothetical protein M3765_12105 [Streptomyces thermoviolaceus]|jgi:hypothetical protein|uniref:hypothetical protein n=1 Tax=Streptomyces thermoviolaceus TaxID=1952 RepID=UPI00204131D1|nr:hypothetical protein [Streptomyces thermoviolaceus]MCM3264759.1 hypothetical protein [Streptomyces thermoviolaceus]
MLPSLLRTIVPLVAGWLIVTLSHLGVRLDSDSAQAAVTLAVSAGYYVLFRLVERTVQHFGGPAWLQSAAGALLGWARPPHYQRTDDIADLVRQSQS